MAANCASKTCSFNEPTRIPLARKELYSNNCLGQHQLLPLGGASNQFIHKFSRLLLLLLSLS